MKVKVTRSGVHVPRRLLGGASEVEIRQEKGRVIVIPLPAADPDADPLFGLGDAPVSCDAPDASEAHDRYLYRPDE